MPTIIPKQRKINENRISPINLPQRGIPQLVRFSFETLERNEYFNLDATCVNWASDLFDVLKLVSKIPVSDIYAGKYSTKGSPLRIHQHANAKPPCELPKDTAIDDMWQIRISSNKGGIHGIFGADGVFYVMWLDPQHNLYPNENYGGLKKLKLPQTCCKERDDEIGRLQEELRKEREEKHALEELINEI